MQLSNKFHAKIFDNVKNKIMRYLEVMYDKKKQKK